VSDRGLSARCALPMDSFVLGGLPRLSGWLTDRGTVARPCSCGVSAVSMHPLGYRNAATAGGQRFSRALAAAGGLTTCLSPVRRGAPGAGLTRPPPVAVVRFIDPEWRLDWRRGPHHHLCHIYFFAGRD